MIGLILAGIVAPIATVLGATGLFYWLGVREQAADHYDDPATWGDQ